MNLNPWLALEHEAVWLYPVIGARFNKVAKVARSSYNSHIATRDGLLARLRRDDVPPVITPLAYDVGPLRTAADAREVARRLERHIAAACLGLVGEVEGQDRAFVTAALRRTALAELSWGGHPSAFPGMS